MTPTQPQLDLAELRRLAEAATPGEWFRTENSDEFGGDLVNGEGDYIAVDHEGLVGCIRNGPDLDFMEAANPQTILRLLDEYDEMKRALGYELAKP